MSRWIIEEWYDPSMSPEQYFSYFDTTKNAFRELSGATMVGGGGFALMQKGHSLQELLQMWRNYGTVPDFISIYCYPVMPVHKDDVKAFFPLYDPDYILHQIKKTREYMELSGMGSVKLFVTEWNFTVSQQESFSMILCLKGLISSKICWIALIRWNMLHTGLDRI